MPIRLGRAVGGVVIAASLTVGVTTPTAAAEPPAMRGEGLAVVAPASPDLDPGPVANPEIAEGKGGPNGGQGAQLSDTEEQELLKKAMGVPYDKKIAISAEQKLKMQQKYDGDRNKKKRASLYFDPQDLADEIAAALGIAGGGMLVWWLLKLLSPACGPAAPVCAVVL